MIESVVAHLQDGELKRGEIDWEKLTLYVREAVGVLKPDASPGLPLMELYRTNAEVIAAEGTEYLVAVVIERFRRLAEMAESLIGEKADAMELVRLGCVDPVRLFVKNELHTRLKVAQGRMRLICSVSVIDQIVERVLTTEVHKREINGWHWGLTKPGMGLHNEGLAGLMAHFKTMSLPAGTDVTAWDWGVCYWLLMLMASIRSWQYGCGLREERTHTTLWERRMHCLCFSVFVLSDGTRWAQLNGGVMKSGSFWTSAINSWARVVVAFIVATLLGAHRRDAAAMGDDCVEDIKGVSEPVVENVMREYKKLGINIKVMEVGEEFEFCSYRFNTATGCTMPVRPWKLVAAFLYNWPPSLQYMDRRSALSWELRHSPVRVEALEFLDKIAMKLFSAGDAFTRPSLL